MTELSNAQGRSFKTSVWAGSFVSFIDRPFGMLVEICVVPECSDDNEMTIGLSSELPQHFATEIMVVFSRLYTQIFA
jgi:hypothetical protein